MNKIKLASLIGSFLVFSVSSSFVHADSGLRTKLNLASGGHCAPAKGSCKKCTRTTQGAVSESTLAKHTLKVDAAFNKIILHAPKTVSFKSVLKAGGKTVSALTVSCDVSKRCVQSRVKNLSIPKTEKYTMTTETYACAALNRKDPSGRVDTDALLATGDAEESPQDQTAGNPFDLKNGFMESLTQKFTQDYMDVMNSYDDHLPANASMADRNKAYYEFMQKMQRGEVKFKAFGLEDLGDLGIPGLKDLQALGNSAESFKQKYPDWQKLIPTESQVKDLQGLGQTLQGLKQKYPGYKGGQLNQQQLADLKKLGSQIQGLRNKYPDWKDKLPTAEQIKDLQAFNTQAQNAVKANPAWMKHLNPEQQAGIKKWQAFTAKHQQNQAENKKKWEAAAKKWQQNQAKNQQKRAENKKKWEAAAKKWKQNHEKNQQKRAEDKKKWDEFVKNLQQKK